MLDNIPLFFVMTLWSHVHTNYKISIASAEPLGLTRMAGGDKPLNIFFQCGPPELLLQIGKGCKNNFVPNHLMCLGDDVETFFQLNDDLVMCLYIPVQKATIEDEEFGSVLD